MKKLLLGTACCLLATATTPAFAQDDVNEAADSVKISSTTYSYDANNNGVIEPDEFVTYITRTFDSDRDGYLDSTEYESDQDIYIYDLVNIDTSNNDAIKSYTFWDKDKDDKLDASEIESLVANTGIYKKWDYNENGTIDTAEFAKGSFMSYDDNGDNMISMEEWADVVM